MMFLKRAVLLLSTVIALVVFLTVAYLFSGYRERRELLTGTPPANLVTLFAPRDALVRFEAGPHREVLWKQTDPEFVQPPEREDASSTQVLSVVRPPDAVSSEEGMRQELGTDREFWRSRENDGASDDVLQWQEENVEPEMLESAAVITPDYDVVRNGELYKEHSEEHSELSGALQSQEENAARPVLKYKVVKPPQIVGNEEVLVQNNPEFASLQKQSELSHQQDHQQQNQEEEFEEELNVVLVAESSNAEEGRDSVDESNHDKELQVMPFSIGNGVDPETSHNSETEIVDSHKPSAHTFPIRKGFQFPHPQVFLPTNTILGADWVQNLKDYLLTIHPSRSLTITVATKSFIPNLLNWLIAAHLLVQPPMENVLVLAFDRDVHMLMARRKIPNVYVPIRSVMKGLRRGVSTIWMTRFAVIRLLNHWGYDVLQLDNDAIPLKDPRFLYDPYTEYDIVGARGILPFELGRGPWGFTLCMGAALLKGTEKMETLWNAMHTKKMDRTADDQVRINFALHKSHLSWKSKKLYRNHSNVGTNQDGLSVAILPPEYICRGVCMLNTTSQIFIWHKSGGGHSASWKSHQNSKSHIWFLRRDYATRATGHELTGLQWLESIALQDSIENVRQRLGPTKFIEPVISL